MPYNPIHPIISSIFHPSILYSFSDLILNPLLYLWVTDSNFVGTEIEDIEESYCQIYFLYVNIFFNDPVSSD